MQESSEKKHEDEVDEGGDYDETDLGDDVFAASHSAAAQVGNREETWHGTDRDYTYAEVSCHISLTIMENH